VALHLKNQEGDGTVSLPPCFVVGAYLPDGGSETVMVSDAWRTLVEGVSPQFYDFGDLVATPGGEIVIDPPNAILVVDPSL
jgi:hypothetical protein